MTDRTPACTDRELALHAFADGELDALAAIALEEHLRTCAGCRDGLARIGAVRALFSDPEARHETPAGLRSRILATTGAGAGAVSREPFGRRAAPWLGGGVVGAMAASLVLLLNPTGAAAPGFADAIIDGQIRSLQGGHLVDVVTSDRHVVKPWFNGRINFAPPVVDLKDGGYPLVGGRLDVIERENVAVLVYRRNRHTINLFIRPAQAEAVAAQESRAGYNVDHWTDGGLEFWAVSDLRAPELADFRDEFVRATATLKPY